jgi:glycosyltransferase involved in cell wall biosynthesis
MATGSTGVAYRLADRIVAVSKGVADNLADLLQLNRSRISVIYNPVVDTGFFERAAEPVRIPWRGDHKGKLLISVGRHVPQKDPATLLRAVALVSRDRDVRLMVLGCGPQMKALRDLSVDLRIDDRVALLGFVLNPLPYIRAADLLVLSSCWEGLPSVLIESMALGTPVVSTRCPFGPEEVLQNGRLGALTPVGDAQALADAIHRTLEDPVPAAALEKAAREYNASTVATEYLRVLEERHTAREG